MRNPVLVVLGLAAMFAISWAYMARELARRPKRLVRRVERCYELSFGDPYPGSPLPSS